MGPRAQSGPPPTAPDSVAIGRYPICMKKTPLLAALLLALPAAASAQNVTATRVTTANLQTSAVIGMSAAGTINGPSGLGILNGNLFSPSFKSLIYTPLAAAYEATIKYQAQVFRGSKVFFTSSANVLSYKPTP